MGSEAWIPMAAVYTAIVRTSAHGHYMVTAVHTHSDADADAAAASNGSGLIGAATKGDATFKTPQNTPPP